jgi:hypothetical protein
LELKRNIQLEASDFQSMVSGEEVSVPKKNQCAQAVPWKIPGLLCGNEAPGRGDAQGAISRRMAVINFIHRIREKDSNPDLLQTILDEELAAIIIKCNMAYRDKASRHEGEDIWKILPQYFKDERRSLQRLTDPLVATIWDEVKYELHQGVGDYADFFILFDTFEGDYKRRWRDLKANSYPDALNVDKYNGPFADAGLRVESCVKNVDGMPREDVYICGIREKRQASSRNDL